MKEQITKEQVLNELFKTRVPNELLNTINTLPDDAKDKAKIAIAYFCNKDFANLYSDYVFQETYQDKRVIN